MEEEQKKAKPPSEADEKHLEGDLLQATLVPGSLRVISYTYTPCDSTTKGSLKMSQ